MKCRPAANFLLNEDRSTCYNCPYHPLHGIRKNGNGKRAMTDHGTPEDKSAESPVLERLFDEKTRRELIEEDRHAWKMVCGLLFSIVLGGVLLGFVGVMLAT